MGKRSRDKGKRGELEARDRVRELWGVPGCRRSAQVSGALTSDLTRGPQGLHLEVKRWKRIAACRFMEQAERDARGIGDVPVVLMREDGGPWMVLVPLDRSMEFAECLTSSS